MRILSWRRCKEGFRRGRSIAACGSSPAWAGIRTHIEILEGRALINRDQAEAFNRAVLDFLDELDPA